MVVGWELHAEESGRDGQASHLGLGDDRTCHETEKACASLFLSQSFLAKRGPGWGFMLVC